MKLTLPQCFAPADLVERERARPPDRSGTPIERVAAALQIDEKSLRRSLRYVENFTAHLKDASRNFGPIALE